MSCGFWIDRVVIRWDRGIEAVQRENRLDLRILIWAFDNSQVANINIEESGTRWVRRRLSDVSIETCTLSIRICVVISNPRDLWRIALHRFVSRGGEVLIVVVAEIQLRSDSDLAHVAQADSGVGRLFCADQYGEEYRGEEQDDAHDHKHFAQGERRSSGHQKTA